MGPLLGVNIDHVATVRQARGEDFPDPLDAALEAIRGGATGITAHLREDRRHIQDQDLVRLKKRISVPLNMEMAATSELIAIAKKIKPEWACLVPERREELTTEGGLDVVRRRTTLKKAVSSLQRSGVKVSLFIDPSFESVEQSADIGANAIEIHTGTYAQMFRRKSSQIKKELNKIEQVAVMAKSLGLLVNAGHGINFENVGALTKKFPFHEYNIGFAIIGRALLVGIRQAVKEMKETIRQSCVAS